MYEGWRVDGNVVTSTAGHGSERDAVQEKVKPGTSGGSNPAVNSKEESELQEGCSPKTAGTKRALATIDPDYAHLPDTKRMREMHQRAQDELTQRVIKVVDKELHKATMEKEAEMEEIDARILKLQQCLHTLRYCVSLSYYNIDVGEARRNETRDRKLSGLHPTVQRHLGKPSASPQQTSETLTTGYTSQQKTPISSTDVKREELCEESQSSNQAVGGTRSTTLTANNRTTATYSSSESPLSSQHHNETSNKSQTGVAKEEPLSRPPSPKYLPPLPPDNTATISQGRQQRFQNKRRLIVGNTYQYLAPLPGEELADSFRYKWQVYVRAPPSDPATSTFLQSVTFVLDHSYAPHHMITIKQPPFVLSRRGWGEFKVQLTLRFIDQRNKPVRLLHPLVLSRPDDALALTGLWRLGQENWYDLWVYLPNSESSSGADGCALMKEEESRPATLSQELETGVISSQVEENITVDHKPTSGVGVTSEHPSKENCTISSDDANEKGEHVSMSENSVSNAPATQSMKNLTPESSLNETEVKDEKMSSQEEREKADRKNIVNGKACIIHVRQADGSLKPYIIPSHLYPVALQMARNYTEQNKPSSDIIGSNSLTQKKKLLQGVVYEGQDIVAQGNKAQVSDTLKPITLKLPTHQSASSSSNNMIDRLGTIGTTPERTIQLTESESRLRVIQTATDTATTTCPQHLLLQIGMKEKKLALLQKQHNSKIVKQVSTSDNLHLSQVQMLSPQTPSHKSLTTVKDVSGVPSTELSQVVYQNHKPAGNVRFITSNGQLLTAEKLKGLRLQIHTNVGKCGVATSNLAAATTTHASATASTTPTINTTATSTSTGALLIQGDQVVTGVNTLQLVTNQDKMTVKQFSPLNMHSSKASEIPVQPLMLCNKSNLVVLKSSGGLVKSPCCKIKMEDSNEMKLLKGKDSLSLKRAASGACSKTDPNSEKNLTGSDNREHQLEEEQEKGCSTYWEDYLSRVCKVCSSSISSAVCVSLWLKVLPLVQPSHMPRSPFSFCRATSYQHFLSWPLAKQRACEFQRAREVKWWLEECHVKGWERWTVPRIVAWARSCAHTPVARRPVLWSDKLQLAALAPASVKSLSHVGDLQELEQQNHQSDTACTSDSPEVDVMGLEEKEESHGGSKRIPGSPLKRQLNYLQWEEAEISSACEWVGQLTSQLRLPLRPEEVAEGYMADAARATLWKAVRSLMEDLLRAAHFQAWNEGTDVPPTTITLPHVLAALTSSRPEFDVFTDHGLGTPTEAM